MAAIGMTHGIAGTIPGTLLGTAHGTAGVGDGIVHIITDGTLATMDGIQDGTDGVCIVHTTDGTIITTDGDTPLIMAGIVLGIMEIGDTMECVLEWPVTVAVCLMAALRRPVEAHSATIMVHEPRCKA